MIEGGMIFGFVKPLDGDIFDGILPSKMWLILRGHVRVSTSDDAVSRQKHAVGSRLKWLGIQFDTVGFGDTWALTFRTRVARTRKIVQMN